MSKQDSGSMTTTNELRSSHAYGHGRNLEEASIARSIEKPVFQIRVRNILDLGT